MRIDVTLFLVVNTHILAMIPSCTGIVAFNFKKQILLSISMYLGDNEKVYYHLLTLIIKGNNLIIIS